MMTPRDLSKCAVRQAKYVFITLPDGGIANDPVLLRLEENRFWLSLADSDIGLWAQCLAYHSGLDVTIGEVDVAPVQIQGPKSREVMAGLFGEKILEIPTITCPRISSWTACGCACRGPVTRASSATRSTCTTRRRTAPSCGTRCSRPGGRMGSR